MTEARPAPPPPGSVSEQAQQYLAAPRPFNHSAEPSDPAAYDEWVSYVEEMDKQIAVRLGAGLGEPPLPVEEFVLDGVTTYAAQPPDANGSTPIYIDLHGGALIMGGGSLLRFSAAIGALSRGMIAWSLDYRMPPWHPYPAALDDCLALYRRALADRSPEDIFVGGGSAGGNLAAALLVRARDEGLPMPQALVLLSPEVDLTESGDTFTTNLGIDPVLGRLMKVNLLYANGHDLADPYLSPLFADLTGFPPTFLQCGTRDVFLSNTVRMHRKLLASGSEAELHIWEAMPHGGFGGMAPEDTEVATAVRTFLDKHRRDRLGT